MRDDARADLGDPAAYAGVSAVVQRGAVQACRAALVALLAWGGMWAYWAALGCWGLVGWSLAGPALARDAELYRCAVSFAGVSNLIDRSRHESRFIGAEVADKQIGNYWRDRDQLKKTSPSERAREITVPVLLVHGTQDRSVPYEQSVTMAQALKAAGKPFKFVTLTDGDHHLSRQADRLQFFTELEAFLALHLGSTAAH